MPAPEEIHLDPQAPPGSRRLWRLRRLARRPGLRRFRFLTHRALAVAEPAGRVHLAAQPSGAHAHSGDHLTVLSANLWHDWPRQARWLERLEAVARLADQERADILLLQEVARTRALRSDEWLAGRLKMAYAYSRANGHESGIGFEEGLAVFSRFPLSAPRLRQLGNGTNPFVRRLALGAQAATPFGDLLAVSVHLGLRRRHNAIQLEQLRDWVAGLAAGGAAVVGGDFNAPEGGAQIAATQRSWLDTFRHLHPHADGATHELRWPWRGGAAWLRQRLDYIFLRPDHRPWRVLETRHLDAPGGPHSDHRAVLTMHST